MYIKSQTWRGDQKMRPRQPWCLPRRPRALIARPRCPTAQPEWLEVGLPIFGKAVTLFVGFTAALNWIHYRDLRKKKEDESESEGKK